MSGTQASHCDKGVFGLGSPLGDVNADQGGDGIVGESWCSGRGGEGGDQLRSEFEEIVNDASDLEVRHA